SLFAESHHHGCVDGPSFCLRREGDNPLAIEDRLTATAVDCHDLRDDRAHQAASEEHQTLRQCDDFSSLTDIRHASTSAKAQAASEAATSSAAPSRLAAMRGHSLGKYRFRSRIISTIGAVIPKTSANRNIS